MTSSNSLSDQRVRASNAGRMQLDLGCYNDGLRPRSAYNGHDGGNSAGFVIELGIERDRNVSELRNRVDERNMSVEKGDESGASQSEGSEDYAEEEEESDGGGKNTGEVAMRSMSTDRTASQQAYNNVLRIEATASKGNDSESARLKEGTNYYTSLLSSFPPIFKGQEGDTAAGNEKKGMQTPEQSLRQILSDPISGDLMEDALIFICGHSFGAAGIQRIQETHVCYICQACVDAGSPNFALRSAVQAYKQDLFISKSSSTRSSKRRRDQDGSDHPVDGGRNKGVQFPYVVSDKVLIKGNKRTPERFVGKQAIITTQCLNGWYLVRTLDNGESVRLQYRSLQKLEDGQQQHSSISEFASVDIHVQNS